MIMQSQRLRSTLAVISLITIFALSIVALGGAASVVADDADSDDELDVIVNDTVETDEEVTLTVASEDAEYLEVNGDTEGWTVTDMEPSPSVIGNPTDFPYESGDENWFYGESTHDELTITLDATVETGEYEFTAVEQDLDNNVVAETEFTITVSEKQITVDTDTEVVENATTELTIESDNAEHLRLDGDTEGWTVTGMDPSPSIIGSPTEFPYESGDEAWFYADGNLDELTITLDATVEPGTDYQFTAAEWDGDDALISEESVTISVVEGHESGVSEDLFNEVDEDGDGDVNLDEIRNGVNQWGTTGNIGEADANLSDIRQLVDYWSSN